MFYLIMFTSYLQMCLIHILFNRHINENMYNIIDSLAFTLDPWKSHFLFKNHVFP